MRYLYAMKMRHSKKWSFVPDVKCDPFVPLLTFDLYII